MHKEKTKNTVIMCAKMGTPNIHVGHESGVPEGTPSKVTLEVMG